MKKKIVKLTLLCGMVVTLATVSACGSANVSVDTELDVNISTEQDSEEASGESSEASTAVVMKLVKEESATYEIADDGSKTEDSTSDDIYEYDAKGNVIKKTYYCDGILLETWKYTYDENGNMIENSLYEGGSPNLIMEYAYDEKGNMVTEKMTSRDTDIEMVTTYAYDEDGNMIREEYKSTKGGGISICKATEYTYDEDGNCIHVKTLYDGEVVSEDTNEYDENGNLIKTSNLRAEDTNPRITIYEYTYDYEGNILKSIKKDEQGSKTIAEYTYDTNGNILTYVKGGAVLLTDAHYEYEYDANNNLIKEVKYFGESNDLWHTIEYTYDENNNLIKKVYSTDDTVIETTYTYVEMEITE